jgi:N-acetylmuramoyl-L-alanine amidase
MKYNSLRLGQNEGQVKVVLDLGGPVKAKYFTLANPNRFVIDLLGTVRTGSQPAINFSNTPIKKIRAGIRKGNDLRIVIDLKQVVKGKAFVIPPSGKRGHRLVVELSGYKPVQVAKIKKPTAKKAVKTAPKRLVKTNKPTKKIAKAVTRQSYKAPVKKVTKLKPQESQKIANPARQIKKKVVVVNEPVRDIVVAIDAGHGGIDPGAKGYKGTREKDVVLAIARKLADRIRREPGMKPVLVRDGDYFISLRNRIGKARAHRADMFISIHADAFPDRRAKGSSVYALSSNGATTEAARVLANRENDSDLIGGVSLDDKDALLASVLLDLSQSATIDASLDVAGRVLKGLKGVGKVHKRRVEQASFAVLKSPDMPSILIETAFISNPREERNLRSNQYQDKLAGAMMSGIRSYFISNPPPGSRLAALEHVAQRGETLSGIASHYSIRLKTLRLANNLNNDRLRVGQVLQIPTSGS